jgi:hypothetical protein
MDIFTFADPKVGGVKTVLSLKRILASSNLMWQLLRAHSANANRTKLNGSCFLWLSSSTTDTRSS